MKTSNFDYVVVGAGVAGMTAAIYLKRANAKVIIIEKSAPGGQINRTAKIENYPGFESIEGPVLAMNIFNQVNKLGIEYRYGDVINIEDIEDQKIITTDTEEIICKAVIIATGRSPRELGLENEKQLTGRGISWCAICDGIFYKDRKVAVVGGGNSALEEAIYLSNICEEVFLIHRRDEFRADNILVDKIKNKSNIKIMYNSIIKKIHSEDNKLSGLVVETGGSLSELKVSGLFIYIGFEPDTKFLKNLSIKLDNGYIVVDTQMRTNIKNIYACGDVIKKEVYQLSTAIGEAATAALSAEKDINK